ncbi:MAG TPA: choice-of-anchor Q domain-containing protein [bacterium]|nr:choice-of-anchor Q domain-containing protein [bacterium]
MKSLLAAVIACFAVSTASAAEFVVTKTADTADGSCDTSDCSLREAVIAANGQAGDDVITLPAGLYILKLDGSGEDLAATGDLDVTDTLTVNGSGAESTVIHGGGGVVSDPDRAFDVSGAANFTLNGVTIRNGAPPMGSGGGVALDGTGNLTIDSCLFLENHAGVQSSGGGAVNNTSGSPTPTAFLVRSSVFRANFADRQGGGLFSTGADLTIEDSEISGNAGASGGFAHSGPNGASATVTRTTISNNDGMGIHSSGAPLTVEDSSVTGNLGNSDGGGIVCIEPGDTSDMTIVNTVVSGNRAEDATGIAKFGGTLTLTGVTVEDNVATLDFGGGIVFGGTDLTINGGSVIRGNISETDGAGIFTTTSSGTTSILIEDSTIEQNDSHTGDGGGLWAENADAVFRKTVFRNNFGDRGGGLRLTGSSQASIEDSTFDGNLAATFGGGVYGDANAPLAIVRSTFSDNAAGSIGGGVLYLSASNLSVENSTFSGNDASAIANTGNATITNATFFGNTSLLPGAAIVGTGAVTIANSALISDAGDNCQHPILSGGHNLDADGSCGLAASGDQNVDPQLGPLADNGGPTLTHAPLEGSPAIDGGDNSQCPATDQRGVARPLDGNADGSADCDVGAVELTGCGDGVVQEGEECDDGNVSDGDDCNADCTLPSSSGTTGGDTTGGTAGTGGATGSVEDASGGCNLIL